jgi:hypothetical protein
MQSKRSAECCLKFPQRRTALKFMNRNSKFVTMLLTGGLLAYASCCRSSEHRDQT